MRTVYRYEFDESVNFESVEASFVLAIFSTESLHGEALVRLEAAHAIDAAQHTCVIDASTEVGDDLNRLFVGFLTREHGEDGFHVERIVEPLPQPARLAA